MSLAQHAVDTVIAAGQLNDGTGKNYVGNAVASLLEILAVVSIGIGAWQMVQAQAKKGAQNEKYRELALIAGVTAIVAGFLFFLPQWAGIGQGFISGVLR